MTEHQPADADTTADENTEPKPFATFLIEHARGRSHDELSRRLQELLAAIEETGKAGSLTYKLTVKPEPKADHAVVVSDEIKATFPKHERPASIFFVDEKMRLVRNDPRQMTLDSFTED